MMSDSWTQRWNERYRSTAYAYGKKPNNYFAEQLNKLQAGNILLAAEGEGRNAVYAAKQGWDALAFDISIEGQTKALKLAAEYNVSLQYLVGNLPDLPIADASFDALALIYAHLPENIRSNYHAILSKKLKSGAVLIFEGFSKSHIKLRAQNPSVGGPAEEALLFSAEELQHDFADFTFKELKELQIELNEGSYHLGKGSVIRAVAIKK